MAVLDSLTDSRFPAIDWRVKRAIKSVRVPGKSINQRFGYMLVTLECGHEIKRAIKTGNRPYRKCFSCTSDYRQIILSNHTVSPESGCWEWLGRLGDGYACLGKNQRVGRLSYEIFVGQIPEGLHILHSCDNPRCVNPEHLRPGTNSENMQDKVARRRCRYTYTDEKITEVLAMLATGASQGSVARATGVSQAYISRISSGKAKRLGVLR